MIWVRDRGGLLAPEALRPSQEELDSGAFDPQLDEYFRNAIPEEPILEENEWFGGDETNWDSEWNLDFDEHDEKVLPSLQNETWWLEFIPIHSGMEPDHIR